MKNINEKSFFKKNKTYIIGIALALILVITITATSYAYFTATVNNSNINSTIVTTGSMEIEFTDGPEVSLENALPSQYIEKTFSVHNVGTVQTTYDIYLSDLVNTFEDTSDLVYTLTSNDGGQNINETEMPTTPTKIVTAKVLPVNTTHHYTLKIEFKETNDNQDDNKGKFFSSIIRINEVQGFEVAASQVGFSSSRTSVTNVQDALDELATLLR